MRSLLSNSFVHREGYGPSWSHPTFCAWRTEEITTFCQNRKHKMGKRREHFAEKKYTYIYIKWSRWHCNNKKIKHHRRYPVGNRRATEKSCLVIYGYLLSLWGYLGLLSFFLVFLNWNPLVFKLFLCHRRQRGLQAHGSKRILAPQSTSP